MTALELIPSEYNLPLNSLSIDLLAVQCGRRQSNRTRKNQTMAILWSHV
jgi:hypothetical protein